MKIALATICALALTACTPFVPVKGDYSKNERLHAVVDHKVGVREEFRARLMATTDPEQKQTIIQSIVDINLEISQLRKEMGYPVSVDPVLPLSAAPTPPTERYVLTPVPASAFTYKGLPLRSSMAEFMQKVPLYRCAGVSCIFSRVDCQGSSVGILDPAVMRTYNQRSEVCKEGVSFGDSLVLNGYVQFEPAGLSSITLTIPTAMMSTLAASVEARYGPAAVSTTDPFKARSGAEFPNWQKFWEQSGDTMHLEFRSGRVDEGRVVIMSREKAVSSDISRRKQVEKGSKDF